MDTLDARTAAALARWKQHRYRPEHIPFTDAVYSLLTDAPLIELRRSTTRTNEWIVCHKGTSEPAVMTFAGVFAEADPYETGNLIWGNDTPVPPEMNEARVTRFAGFKAAYSYALDTFHDKEIWGLQHTLDEYVATVEGFNSSEVSRLEWQSAENQSHRFYIRVPMFLPHQARGARPAAAPWLHPWVKAAHARTRSYRANPHRPRVRAVEGDTVRDIDASTRPKLEYGDVVGIVFTVVYTETPSSWSPVYMMTDIIRVMPANRDAYPLTDPDSVETMEPDDRELSVAGPNPLGRDMKPAGAAPSVTNFSPTTSTGEVAGPAPAAPIPGAVSAQFAGSDGESAKPHGTSSSVIPALVAGGLIMTPVTSKDASPTAGVSRMSASASGTVSRDIIQRPGPSTDARAQGTSDFRVVDIGASPSGGDVEGSPSSSTTEVTSGTPEPMTSRRSADPESGDEYVRVVRPRLLDESDSHHPEHTKSPVRPARPTRTRTSGSKPRH